VMSVAECCEGVRCPLVAVWVCSRFALEGDVCGSLVPRLFAVDAELERRRRLRLSFGGGDGHRFPRRVPVGAVTEARVAVVSDVLFDGMVTGAEVAGVAV